LAGRIEGYELKMIQASPIDIDAVVKKYENDIIKAAGIPIDTDAVIKDKLLHDICMEIGSPIFIGEVEEKIGAFAAATLRDLRDRINEVLEKKT